MSEENENTTWKFVVYIIALRIKLNIPSEEYSRYQVSFPKVSPRGFPAASHHIAGHVRVLRNIIEWDKGNEITTRSTHL